jgi:hypothetical protein
MAAAAVEKSATFSRDASNCSRNSQLGMANLCYFDIIDVSTLQRPVLLLGLYTTETSVASGCVYTTKACAAQRHIYTTKARAEPRCFYTTEESASSGRVYITSWCPVLLLKVSTHRGLCSSWRSLHYRGLSCLWTCLHFRGWCWSWTA